MMWRMCHPPYLLLSQYHSLDVFKLSLKPVELLSALTHAKTAWTVSGGAQTWEMEAEKEHKDGGQKAKKETVRE